MNEKLANIIYLTLPADAERRIGQFQLDPERLLPVETTGGEDRDISDLSWEQIVATMLKILAYAPEHEDAGYYREFILAVNPGIVVELTEAAILKSRNGDYDLAEEIFLALRALEPTEPRTLVNLALLYEERVRSASRSDESSLETHYTERALQTYQELWNSDDAVPEAHLNAGFFHMRLHDYARAREHLAVYAQTGTDDERREEAARAIREIDDHRLSDDLFRQAYDAVRAGNEAHGIELIRTFLEKNPDVWNAWFILGWGLRRLRQFDEARKAFERSLEGGPRQPDTLNELAICSMELDDLGTARSLLLEALTAEPENTKIISNLGILALKTGRTTEAAGYFRTVLDLEPNDRVAQAFLDQLSDT